MSRLQIQDLVRWINRDVAERNYFMACALAKEAWPVLIKYKPLLDPLALEMVEHYAFGSFGEEAAVGVSMK